MPDIHCMPPCVEGLPWLLHPSAETAPPHTPAAPQVCELLAKQAWRQARDLLKTGTPGNPVS